jgi:hypothetical protein
VSRRAERANDSSLSRRSISLRASRSIPGNQYTRSSGARTAAETGQSGAAVIECGRAISEAAGGRRPFGGVSAR